jgi:hypothetical protein
MALREGWWLEGGMVELALLELLAMSMDRSGRRLARLELAGRGWRYCEGKDKKTDKEGG